jgi:shikimate kinase
VNEPIRCVAIFGGPGSGKRSVADALAKRLEWAFVDFDAEIARREGKPVPHLLESISRDSVRQLTHRLVEESIAPQTSVVAFDGRWPGNPIALQQLRPAVLAVWLSAAPQEAVRRMRADDRHHRLLEHPRPADAVVTVLRKRASLREQMDLKLPTDGLSVEEVAFAIEQLVRSRGCTREASGASRGLNRQGSPSGARERGARP